MAIDWQSPPVFLSSELCTRTRLLEAWQTNRAGLRRLAAYVGMPVVKDADAVRRLARDLGNGKLSR